METRPARAQRAEAAARFVRLFSMGATVLYVLVGLASAARAPSFGAVFGGVAIGVAFHVFAYTGNDVMDLPLDATDPRRSRGPLVTGTIRPQTGLFAALASVPIVYLLLASQGADRTAMIGVTAALALVGLYNLVGKAVPVPLVGDLLQGAAWAGLVLAGAELAGGATAATVWAMAFVTTYTSMVNGLHGALRDAQNDAAQRARTTALLLGASVSTEGVRVPPMLAVYGAALQVLLTALLMGALATDALAYRGGRSLLAWGATTATLGASSVMLLLAYRARADLRRSMAFGTWHLFLVAVALLVAYAWALPAWAVVTAAAAFLLPPKLFDLAVRDTEFGLPATTQPEGVAPGAGRPAAAAIWEMTRSGTWMAGAGLAFAGAVVGGLRWPEVLSAMATSALVVAAANAFNDRCDVEADVVNRPDRPLPSGRVSGNAVDRFVMLTSVAAIVVASPLGAEAAALAGALLALALGYSLFLRRWLATGAATVGALFASPLLYGAAVAADEAPVGIWLAAVPVAVVVLAREILKGVPDQEGDRLAGYRTVATQLGERTAVRAFRVVVLAALTLALVPVAHDSLGVGYLAAVLVFGGGPILAALWRLGTGRSREAIEGAIATAGLVFGTGLVPLLVAVEGIRGTGG